MKTLSTAKRNRFVLQLLLSTANRYLSYLREINKIVDTLEDQLQLSLRNKEVLELLKYQKSLVYFTTALRSNELVMERLQKSQMFRQYPDDEDLLEDVLTENQQAIEMVGIANDILSQMMDAFASIISNNLNSVMKFLASITIVMAIPTMVASFYGMNVDLPLAHNGFLDFWMVLGISICIALVVIVLFWRKDWF
jgi:magnesium transporter